MAINHPEKSQMSTEAKNWQSPNEDISTVEVTCKDSACALPKSETLRLFPTLWRKATDQNYLTLFGFRRFRTAHLLNLRFLEEEIHKIDHDIFQAGIQLGYPPTTLGLEHAKKDVEARGANQIVTQELALKLRELLKQYGTHKHIQIYFVEWPDTFVLRADGALTSLNNVMMMETFALADNVPQSNLRTDLHEYEKYKTRLVRVDLARRTGPRDVLRHGFRKSLRYFWFFICRGGSQCNIEDVEASSTAAEATFTRKYQNIACLAECLTRFVIAILAGAFLVVPLFILSHQSSGETHLITVSVCIVIFSLLVSLVSKASNEQTMAASAGYAAVLVVFLSNASN